MSRHNDMQRTIGAVIARFRLHAGITQAELAHALGVSQGTVSKWETGAQDMTVEDLCRVADSIAVPAWVMLAEAETGTTDFSPIRMETLLTLLAAPRERTLP